MSADTVELVKRCHADFGAFAAAAHDSIEWIAERNDPDAATHRGWGEIGRFFGDWVRSYPDMEMTPLEYVDYGDKVLAWVRLAGAGSTSGIGLEMELAQVWTVRDGQVLRVEEFRDRAEAEAACRT